MSGALLAAAAFLSVWALRGEPSVLILAGAVVPLFAWLDARAGVELPARDAGGTLAARVAAPVFLVAAVVALGWPALRGDFLGDDFGYVRLFDSKPWASFLRLGDVSEGIWGQPLDELRPVFALSFKLGLALHGVSAAGFLATNLLLHAANSLLVYALVRALAPGRVRTALLAGLLFGGLPVHAEAVAWITGKVDLLPTCFYLATVLLFVRFRQGAGRGAYAGAVALYAVGIFSKEILVTLPLMLLAYDALLAPPPAAAGPRARWLSLAAVQAPFAGIAAAFLLARRAVFDTFAREGRVGTGLVTRFLEQQPEKARALLAPVDAWLARPAPAGGEAAATLAQALTGIALGLLLALAFALWRRRERQPPALALAAFFGVVWYAVTVLPLVVTYASARHLYLPSCGSAVALALLVFPPTRDGGLRAGWPRVAGGVLLLAFHAFLLRAALEEWADAGAFSRLARVRIEAATRALAPDDTLVLVGFPVTTERLLVWKFALPFALQPPYVARDVYGAQRVLEPRGLFSQPPAEWWRRKKDVLRALLDGAPDERVGVAVLRWDAAAGELRVHRTRPTRGLLRAQAFKVLEAPFEELDDLDPRRANRLVGALADAARHAPR